MINLNGRYGVESLVIAFALVVLSNITNVSIRDDGHLSALSMFLKIYYPMVQCHQHPSSGPGVATHSLDFPFPNYQHSAKSPVSVFPFLLIFYSHLCLEKHILQPIICYHQKWKPTLLIYERKAGQRITNHHL